MRLSRADVETLPKVELHVHLEGTIRASTAMELARRHGRDPEHALLLEDGEYPQRFRDFAHFVAVFTATSRQIETADDLVDVAADFARGQARQGVAYTEVHCTVMTLVRFGMDPTDLFSALRAGFDQVPDVSIALVCDSIRDFGIANAADTVRVVGEVLERGDGPDIVALGLTGTEGSVPERSFSVIREACDRLGLHLAVHAGETGGPDNIRSALDDLGAERIGHGITVLQDLDLARRCADEQVPFEVCPRSNVRLGLVPGLDAHPLPAMRDAGLAVTVNSDDPPFFATTLTDELWWAAGALDLDRAGLADLQRTAIRASFASDTRKRQLLDELDAWERD